MECHLRSIVAHAYNIRGVVFSNTVRINLGKPLQKSDRHISCRVGSLEVVTVM